MLCVALVCLSGCKRPFAVPEPDSDEAFISEHYIEGTDGWDYAILEIDGHTVRRETMAFGVDLEPRAVVGVGEHKIKVSQLPHARTRLAVARIREFRGTVVGGREYFVGTKDGEPRLVEVLPAKHH